MLWKREKRVFHITCAIGRIHWVRPHQLSGFKLIVCLRGFFFLLSLLLPFPLSFTLSRSLTISPFLSRLVVISLSISLSFSVTSKVFLASRFFSASSFDMSVGFNRSLMHKNNTIDDVQTISKISINVTNDCNARRFYNIDNIIFMSSSSF